MVQPSHCPWCGAPSYHMVLVDHELVAALEQVQERDRAVGSDDLDRPVELHHRQPAAGRGEGVALAGVGLLADQKLVTGGLPGGQVDDGRAAGQRGGRVVSAWSSWCPPWCLVPGSVVRRLTRVRATSLSLASVFWE